MKRKFLKRLQANFQSVIMCSVVFGIGAYCGMANNLLKNGTFERYQMIALLVGFSAIGIGTIFFSMFYLILGGAVRKCARKTMSRITESVKAACLSTCKALEKAKNRLLSNAGITIFAQQSRI